ncbi:M1 family metallopeptidase [Pedobacter sp. JY14-1]|uniref:M1 family metallopeptidase n=1 Tax=Pedobacter sp. JY14-1 TaxID=3034151 RepID=UPI0023E2A45C|nr:M1 family metallopeptidase [Pedobacter sp. JY14-1]
MKSFLFLSVILLMFSCNGKKEPVKTIISAPVRDPHSFARPEEAVAKHLTLAINVDFKRKEISGRASWKIRNISGGNQIVFDNSGLYIARITLGREEKETTFELGDSVKFLGRALKVNIRPETDQVNIYYTTGKDAAALQWLEPQQTSGKKNPYLFTQSESIAARSWIPCQDSPGIRFTYDAQVTVPSQLLALMSAENPKAKNPQGIYQFRQKHAIPAYLLALAVGDITFRPVDQRTGIYAEPQLLGKAAHEFADLGKMVHAAEGLYGPYRWGRYDLLILPPSFPFGGMENPNLSFITPTIIAGDRSLVSIICHELAHSWSGNLVTNATWNDFWLNEGFTNYFERRIDELLYGREEAEMQEEFGKQALLAAVKEMGPGHKDTRLKADYTGRSADDGTNDIAYEKGYFFLKTIEHFTGRDRFDRFLRDYFDSHAFQSVSTEDFVSYLNTNLISGDTDLAGKINVREWVYGTGIPGNIVYPDGLWNDGKGKFAVIQRMAAEYAANRLRDPAALKEEVKSSNEKRFFISQLPGTLTSTQMAGLDTVFGFTRSHNTDIQLAWYLLAIRKGYSQADPNIRDYLIGNGRMWHIIPLYKAMMNTPAGLKKARDIYKAARPNYHPMTYKAIDAFLL